MPTRRLAASFLVIALLVAALAAVDLWRLPGTVSPGAIFAELFEALFLVGAMAAVAWTMTGVVALRDGQAALANNLARAVAQGDKWRAERRAEIAAFSEAIEDQFRAWRLTAAEIDIAGLMLKGCSLKEIALARDTSEATIRQQAQSVYRKSGLSGRAELSAYFMESLFSAAEDGGRGRPGLTLVSTTSAT